MAVNIFGSRNNDSHDIVRDLDLNTNAIHNVKDAENEHDVANKRYGDSKSSSVDGWTLEGKPLQSDGKLGTSNVNSFTLVRKSVISSPTTQLSGGAESQLCYIYIFIMKSCTKHTKKKKKYNRLDNHAALQVSANCLVCADKNNKCMKFFAIKINVIRKN